MTLFHTAARATSAAAADGGEVLLKALPTPHDSVEQLEYSLRPSRGWLHNYRLSAIALDALLAWLAATGAVLIRYDPAVELQRVPYLVVAAVFPFRPGRTASTS